MHFLIFSSGRQCSQVFNTKKSFKKTFHLRFFHTLYYIISPPIPDPVWTPPARCPWTSAPSWTGPTSPWRSGRSPASQSTTSRSARPTGGTASPPRSSPGSRVGRFIFTYFALLMFLEKNVFFLKKISRFLPKKNPTSLLKLHKKKKEVSWTFCQSWHFPQFFQKHAWENISRLDNSSW